MCGVSWRSEVINWVHNDFYHFYSKGHDFIFLYDYIKLSYVYGPYFLFLFLFLNVYGYIYVCIHVYIFEYVHMYGYMCVCVMAPEISIENHPQSLFHLTRWEWLFQQNPKLPDMLVSLASWLWGCPVPTRGYHQQMLTQVPEIHTPLLRCAWKILNHWVISKDMFHMILLYPFTCW